MAKALLGSMSSDPRTTRLAAENRRLRMRVEELEVLVLRLREDSDAELAAARDLLSLDQPSMQPA